MHARHARRAALLVLAAWLLVAGAHADTPAGESAAHGEPRGEERPHPPVLMGVSGSDAPASEQVHSAAPSLEHVVSIEQYVDSPVVRVTNESVIGTSTGEGNVRVHESAHDREVDAEVERAADERASTVRISEDVHVPADDHDDVVEEMNATVAKEEETALAEANAPVRAHFVTPSGQQAVAERVAPVGRVEEERVAPVERVGADGGSGEPALPVPVPVPVVAPAVYNVSGVVAQESGAEAVETSLREDPGEMRVEFEDQNEHGQHYTQLKSMVEQGERHRYTAYKRFDESIFMRIRGNVTIQVGREEANPSFRLLECAPGEASCVRSAVDECEEGLFVLGVLVARRGTQPYELLAWKENNDCFPVDTLKSTFKVAALVMLSMLGGFFLVVWWLCLRQQQKFLERLTPHAHGHEHELGAVEAHTQQPDATDVYSPAKRASISYREGGVVEVEMSDTISTPSLYGMLTQRSGGGGGGGGGGGSWPEDEQWISLARTDHL